MNESDAELRGESEADMRLCEIRPDPFEKGKDYVERLLRLTSQEDQVIVGDFGGTPVAVFYGDNLTIAYNRMKQLYYERVTAYRNTDEWQDMHTMEGLDA